MFRLWKRGPKEEPTYEELKKKLWWAKLTNCVYFAVLLFSIYVTNYLVNSDWRTPYMAEAAHITQEMDENLMILSYLRFGKSEELIPFFEERLDAHIASYAEPPFEYREVYELSTYHRDYQTSLLRAVKLYRENFPTTSTYVNVQLMEIEPAKIDDLSTYSILRQLLESQEGN